MEGDGSGVSYRLQGKTGLLRINDGGRVELLRTLGSTITRQLNKAEFTIRAFKRGTRQRAETRLIIVVLALHFGDEFIDRVSKIQVSTEEGHARRKMSPLSLLHFLRHPTGEAKKIGMAELVWELKIAKIKYLILDGIGKQHYFLKIVTRRVRKDLQFCHTWCPKKVYPFKSKLAIIYCCNCVKTQGFVPV